MHFLSSLIAVALLGLGNVLPSANGAPSGLSQRRSPSGAFHDLLGRADITIPKIEPEPVIEPHLPPPPPPPPAPRLPGVTAPKPPIEPPVPKTYPAKPVPNPFDSKYGYSKAARPQADPNWGTVYDVKTPNYKNGVDSVDVIAINTDKNSIGIMEAFNKEDVPADATKKLALADIEMSLFTLAGKTPQDLKLIHVDNIVNTETKSAIVSVYGMLKESTLTGNTITLRATGKGPELDGYNTLAGTPFGLGADKLRQQFSVGKTVGQYTLYGHNDASGNRVFGAFDMDITFA